MKGTVSGKTVARLFLLLLTNIVGEATECFRWVTYHNIAIKGGQLTLNGSTTTTTLGSCIDQCELYDACHAVSYKVLGFNAECYVFTTSTQSEPTEIDTTVIHVTINRKCSSGCSSWTAKKGRVVATITPTNTSYQTSLFRCVEFCLTVSDCVSLHHAAYLNECYVYNSKTASTYDNDQSQHLEKTGSCQEEILSLKPQTDLSLSLAAIIGIACGGFVLLCCLIIVIVLLILSRKRMKKLRRTISVGYRPEHQYDYPYDGQEFQPRVTEDCGRVSIQPVTDEGYLQPNMRNNNEHGYLHLIADGQSRSNAS